MQTFTFSRNGGIVAIIMAASLACSFAAQAQQAQPVQPAAVDIKGLLPDPTHRAIFCGTDGGDASRAYSEAVSRAITTLIDRGVASNAAQAIELMKKALCQGSPK